MHPTGVEYLCLLSFILACCCHRGDDLAGIMHMCVLRQCCSLMVSQTTTCVQVVAAAYSRPLHSTYCSAWLLGSCRTDAAQQIYGNCCLRVRVRTCSAYAAASDSTPDV
jgi:hypothetical protein